MRQAAARLIREDGKVLGVTGLRHDAELFEVRADVVILEEFAPGCRSCCDRLCCPGFSDACSSARRCRRSIRRSAFAKTARAPRGERGP
jgi:hypothetical protein